MKRLILAAVASLMLVGVAPAQDAVTNAALELSARVAALEQRVTALEQRAGVPQVRETTIAQSGPMVLGSTPTVVTLRPTAPAGPTVVPPGQHAHRTVDGRVIVHGDWNQGNAAAHAGVAYPWAKVAVAGQTVMAGQDGVSGCPAGGCPPGGHPAGSGRQPLFTPFGGRFRR